MKCKKHYSDLSSTVGVCASCLRERLTIILAAQAQADSQNPRAVAKLHAPSQQPPLIFPRSVSPYVTRRKTEPLDQRFYSTPQLGRAWHSHAPPETKKKGGKLGMISRFFGLRSDKNRNSEIGFDSGCRKNVAGGRISCRDRGMSPESESESGYSTITGTIPVVRKKKAIGLGREISLCLSPLVRASPNRNWGIKSGTDVGFSGEFRKTPTHLSSESSFCKNRSRKLADFGRGFR